MAKDSPADWQPGEVLLDKYEVKGILGKGGMGTVYLVHHREWNQDLALKCPQPQIFRKEGGKEDFIQEAETWVTLQLHPHIVSCYYVRLVDEIPCLFAEYLSEGSLAEWIRQRRLYVDGHQAALERMLDVAIQFAWGLHAAHEQGLVHQDIKPHNVMMTPDAIAKVADFGLAKARTMAGGEGSPSGEQSILVSWGGMTPAYCSPEQAARQPLSRKTDIWSWGVSVLHMFVGKVTWVAGSLAREALAKHKRQSKDIPTMPAELVKLLARCFEERPEMRPTSMMEVADELQAIYKHQLGRPYPREVPPSAKLLASSLNNQALSLYDLGKVEEAKQAWERALKADPQHLETIYNRGIVLWRRGELHDDVLVQQMEALRARAAQVKPWQIAYLLAQVHLERGDVDAALPLLEKATLEAPDEAEVQLLFKRTQMENMTSHRYRWFSGHTSLVASVSLSADGRLALSGSYDRTLRLWEVETGQCLRTFKGHSKEVASVSLSADGRLALSGSHDKTLRLWEVETGRCLRIFTGHKYSVYSVSLSADGRLALSGSYDQTLRLWEVETGQCLRIFTGHFMEVTSVILSVDGRLALSGSQDLTVRLWEVESGQCIRTFTGHTSLVTSVSLSADGGLALSGSHDRTLRLWEVETGRCLRTFTGHIQPVASVSLSADGQLALSGSRDQTVRLWEVESGRCRRTFTGIAPIVNSVCLSTDGRLALSEISGNFVQPLKLTNTEQRAPQILARISGITKVLQLEHQATSWLAQAELALQSQRFSEALGLLQKVRALPGWERAPRLLEVWDQMAGYCQKIQLYEGWEWYLLQGHTSSVTSVSLAADGRLALSGSHDRTLRLWEVETGRCLRTFTGHTSWVTSVSLSADGRLALSGSYDQVMRLWEVETGRCLRTFTGHSKQVTSVFLSADGRLALSGSDDRTLRLWEVESGCCLRVFTGHEYPVYSVSLSADGRLALSGSHDRTLRVWEVETGQCLRTCEGHAREVLSISVSADRRLALSGSQDRTLRLWEVETGRCLRVFTGHEYPVYSVSLSADGRLALSGSHDRTLRVWEVESGRCLRVFRGHIREVTAVSLSTDGRLVLSGSHDQTVRLWKLYWELGVHDPAEWDDGAQPYLELFLALHVPYNSALPSDREPSEKEIQQLLTRSGKPAWTEDDFKTLIRQLQYVGYGWLRPEGVRRKLEEMAAAWQGEMDPRPASW